MRSLVTSLARKVVVPTALALGALVAAPSVGPVPAQAAPGVVNPGVAITVGADPAITPVYWRRYPYRYYYAPPPPPVYYYRRPAYGYPYYAPPPPRYYRPRYYYRY